MTGEGFAKVMPAAFGFPWCLIYFWIDKVLPIFISILKLAKGSNHQRTTLLVSQHCITFRRIGCWSSLVESQLGFQKLLLLGCNIAIGIF
jgi:hypothetical protein